MPSETARDDHNIYRQQEEEGEFEHKWVYESIAEKLPLLSHLPRRYNVLAQLFLMELIGIALGRYFELEIRTVLFGSIVILTTILWSILALELGPIIRDFKPSRSLSESLILKRYRKRLFSSRHLEMWPGVVIFVLSFAYLNNWMPWETSLLVTWFGDQANPVVLFLVYLLHWDVSYRMGLGIWVTSVSLVRSIMFRIELGWRRKLEYTPLHDLHALKNIDSKFFLFGLFSLLLIPVFITDTLLTSFLLLYSLYIVCVSFLSLHLIGGIPWLPPDIHSLVEEGMFAHVGTADGRRMPHVTPVAYVFDGHSVYFQTSVGSKKVRNIQQNPRIAFLIDVRDPDDLMKNKAVLITGRARIFSWWDVLPNMIKLFRVWALFHDKYPEYVQEYITGRQRLPEAWQLTPLIRRVPIEVIPETMVFWQEARHIALPV